MTKPIYEHAIIACARWENAYIAEWIAYYDVLGFDHIYLCCNDDDPTELKAVVDACPKSRPDLVSFQHYREQGQQVAMYHGALATARQEAEWVSFLDIDEFLVLRHCDNIKTFMQAMPQDVDSVHFNWVLFGTSGFVDRPQGGVLPQYIRRAEWVDTHTKHLSRVSLLTAERLGTASYPFWHGLLGPEWDVARRVDVLGKDLSNLYEGWPSLARQYLGRPGIRDAILSTACVNHYQFKSESDFARRVSRGVGGQFDGQAAWLQTYESGNYKKLLENLSTTEDSYLRDFSLSRHLPGSYVPKAGWSREGIETPESISWRVVPARHPHWKSDILLGSNGRLQHVEHGSKGSYLLEGDALRVRWDDWPEGNFVWRDGLYDFDEPNKATAPGSAA